LEKFVYVYNFDKLERRRKYETSSNHKGLVALSPIDDCGPMWIGLWLWIWTSVCM
jgi:hypothetical protein